MIKKMPAAATKLDAMTFFACSGEMQASHMSSTPHFARSVRVDQIFLQAKLVGRRFTIIADHKYVAG